MKKLFWSQMCRSVSLCLTWFCKIQFVSLFLYPCLDGSVKHSGSRHRLFSSIFFVSVTICPSAPGFDLLVGVPIVCLNLHLGDAPGSMLPDSVFHLHSAVIRLPALKASRAIFLRERLSVKDFRLVFTVSPILVLPFALHESVARVS
jgi:hypothetical protein